jgi:pyruvate kinase
VLYLETRARLWLQVYSEVEGWVQREKFGYMKYPVLCDSQHDRISEEICTSAANISSRLGAKAIFVYTRTGQTAGFVSRRRPECPIFAVTGASMRLCRSALEMSLQQQAKASCLASSSDS